MSASISAAARSSDAARLIPERLPATPGDITTSAMSEMFEMSLGSRLTFDGRLDEALLSRATRLLLDFEPVLGCWYDENISSAEWVRCAELDELSYFSVAETDDPDAEYAKFHATRFDSRGPRLAVRLLRTSSGDEVCIRFDHIAGDGWCAMELTHLLAETYSRLVEDPEYVPVTRLSARPIHADLWQALTEEQRDAAAKAVPFKGQQWRGKPYAGSGTGLAIRTLTIPADDVSAIRQRVHEAGATLNDGLVAALVRSVASIFPPARGVKPGVTITADMRRFVDGDQFDRVCLLATTQTVDVQYRDGETFDETLQHVVAGVAPHKRTFWNLGGSLKEKANPMLRRASMRMLTGLMRRLRLIAPVTMNLGAFDERRLDFGGVRPVSAVASGIVPKYAGFPVTISSYRGAVTLWSGFRQERMAPELIERCLDGIRRELAGLVATVAAASPALGG